MAKTITVEAKITHKIEKPKSNLLAYASITINESFVVYGVKLLENDKGMFVGMPSQSYEVKKGKKTENKWSDICFPITPNARKIITDAVIEAYENYEE